MTDRNSKSKTPLNRREFLGSSARNAAQAAAGVVAISQVGKLQAKLPATPSDAVRLGFVGLRNQGASLIKSFQQVENCQIAGLCDIDQSVQAAAMKLIESPRRQPFLCDDYRKILDSPEIDAVVIATPDHHHAWMTAMACDAGKDIYLEAPTTHTIEQGVQLQRMISQSQSVVQVGLQQRSGLHFQSAIDYLHTGQLGEVYQARAWSAVKRQRLRRQTEPHQRSSQKSSQKKTSRQEPMLSEKVQLAWLGQEKKSTLHPLDWHYHWRWMWNYGSGELGNWGVHLLDTARWGMNLELPQRVVATGSCRHFNDGRQTPDTMNVLYDFGGKSITWEHRQWSSRGIEGRSHGVAFYGDRGVLILDRSGWKVYDHTPAISVQASELRISHARAFIHAVKNRTEPATSYEVGRISSELCHLGNLAYRNERELRLDDLTGEVVSPELRS